MIINSNNSKNINKVIRDILNSLFTSSKREVIKKRI